MKKRFTEEQIIGFLREAEVGLPVKELCLHTEARLQVKRRKRKKVPVTDRHLLSRPQAANQVWSTDSCLIAQLKDAGSRA